ncbi:MAG: carbon-nitrogen hydrolase family protein, partial [Candidatus Odinarchaeia archaeon]
MEVRVGNNNQLGVKVHLNQIKSIELEPEENINKIISDVIQLKSHQPTLLIYPELFTSGYVINRSLKELNDTINREVNKLINQIKTDNLIVIFGSPEYDVKHNKLFNTAFVVSSKGVLVKYHKIFLPEFWIFKEKSFFTPGLKPGIFKFKNYIIGVQICYDINFPEISRFLTFNGAVIQVVISATPVKSIKRFKILLKARAVENQCYIIYVNKVGSENNIS